MVQKWYKNAPQMSPSEAGEAVDWSQKGGADMYGFNQMPSYQRQEIKQVNGFGGALSVMVGITEDGKVYNTSVISHSETPGLGAKCQSDEGFLGQFRGLDPASARLAVTKDGGDIDAITASTITSRAYTLAVANAVKVFGFLTSENGGGKDNE